MRIQGFSKGQGETEFRVLTNKLSLELRKWAELFFVLEMVKKTRNQAFVVDAAAFALRMGARAEQGDGEADGGEASEPSIE